MSKTIVVFGHGPGISDAVARVFGKEGFNVALVARNASRLTEAAEKLKADGIQAAAFPADLSIVASVQDVLSRVRNTFGPVTVLHWNAYTGGAGDFLSCDLSEFTTCMNVSTTSLIAAVQGSLDDLKQQKNSAVLVTGGGFAYYNPALDDMAVQFNAMGLAAAKAAQHKTVGLLDAKLKALSIYVGEVVVLGMVKGTAFDHGNASLEPNDIAKKFWTMYSERNTVSVNFPQ